jgi:RNA polymerase sigma-70 factor, ECF subfamily
LGWAASTAGRGLSMSSVLPQIEACIPALRRYAAALLRNREDADDLVHDCLVRALDKLDTRRDNAEVRPWLFAIMHNLFISQLRRTRSRPSSESLDETHEAAMSVRADQDSGLNWRDLLRGLNQLPVEQRTVILLVSVEDLSYAEAASVLDIPVGTVMSRLARGRERLRQITEDGEVRPALRRVK